MSMKITEIQIGDWVYNKFHKKPIRITPYDFFTHGHRSDGEQYLLVNSEPAIGRDYDPIPITPEILEKNFERKTYYGIFDDYYDFEIREYNDGMYIINYHSCEMALPPTQIVGICFVHELQHCLALLGIDRKIELPEED